MVLNEPGKACFKVTMSWATAVDGSVSVSFEYLEVSTLLVGDGARITSMLSWWYWKGVVFLLHLEDLADQ